MRKSMTDLFLLILVGLIINAIHKISGLSIKYTNFLINTDRIHEIKITTFFLLILVIMAYGVSTQNSNKIFSFIRKIICISLFISIVFSNTVGVFLTAVLFFLSFEIEQFFEKDTDQKNIKLYPSRIKKAQQLKDIFISEEEESLILIDGEWGIGKTTFVNKVIGEIENSPHKINVDILLFSNREQLINHTMKEINKVLIKEGIKTKAPEQFKNILRIISESKKIKFTEIFDKESLDQVEKDLKDNINRLNNRIYIVVDNLERVLDEKLTIGVLGFLHKLESLTHKKLKIIVLADSKNLTIEKISENYLNKFLAMFHLTVGFCKKSKSADIS